MRFVRAIFNHVQDSPSKYIWRATYGPPRGFLLKLPDIFQDYGSGYSLRVSSVSLYGVSPNQIPFKCWGWSNLLKVHNFTSMTMQCTSLHFFWFLYTLQIVKFIPKSPDKMQLDNQVHVVNLRLNCRKMRNCQNATKMLENG